MLDFSKNLICNLNETFFKQLHKFSKSPPKIFPLGFLTNIENEPLIWVTIT